MSTQSSEFLDREREERRLVRALLFLAAEDCPLQVHRKAQSGVPSPTSTHRIVRLDTRSSGTPT